MKTAIFAGILGVATLGAVGTAVIAKEGGHGPRPAFTELDSNADGKITPNEMAAHHSARMKEHDTDGDGFVSRSEIQAMMNGGMGKRIDRMMDHMDTDEDGKLSVAEMSDGPRGAKRFERADRDGDGALSEDEFERGHKSGHKQGHKEGHGKGHYDD